MALEFSATARRTGICSAVGIVALLIAYASTLAVGFLSLTSPQEPIGDPMFSILEVLIITMMPAMVALMTSELRREERRKIPPVPALVWR